MPWVCCCTVSSLWEITNKYSFFFPSLLLFRFTIYSERKKEKKILEEEKSYLCKPLNVCAFFILFIDKRLSRCFSFFILFKCKANDDNKKQQQQKIQLNYQQYVYKSQLQLSSSVYLSALYLSFMNFAKEEILIFQFSLLFFSFDAFTGFFFNYF